jgi:hypothetical protein
MELLKGEPVPGFARRKTTEQNRTSASGGVIKTSHMILVYGNNPSNLNRQIPIFISVPLTGLKAIDGHEPAVRVDGYTVEQIDYHPLLLEQAGFIHGARWKTSACVSGPALGLRA